MRFEDVWVRYRRTAPFVLTGVTAAVEPGQVVVVGGGNGAGKSTLLGIAAGVLRPTRGAVLDRPSPVGWVPERFPSGQPFTVRSYLSAMAAVRGLGTARGARAVDEWAERLGLAPFLGTALAQLSKGTAQKVGLAQALLVPPALLVLDEPWEGLDASARELVPAIIAEVSAAGGAALLSDHRGEVRRLPDATHWTVRDASLVTAEPDGQPRCVVEIAIPVARAAEEIARLRADGYQVLGVRDQAQR